MSQEETQEKCCCCEGATPLQPMIYNRPGLSTIKYRAGTFGEFKASMFVSLANTPIQTLTTRSSDDLGISLIDAWAAVSDVLTFYQERIANEVFLRTATEIKSILELAREIGYELKPGVAASTHLAFTVDDSSSAAKKTNIGIGVKVQSIPSQNETPQIFETVEEIEARPTLNKLKLRLTKKADIPSLQIGDNRFSFQGLNLKLKVGDGLLVGDGDTTNFLLITHVEEDKENQITNVTAMPDGNYEPVLPITPWGIFVFRTKCSIFGNNASEKADDLGSRNYSKITSTYDDVIPNKNSVQIGLTFYLDNVYQGIVPNSWIILRDSAYEITTLYSIQNTFEESIAAYSLAGKSTGIVVSHSSVSFFHIRSTTVYAQPEQLQLAEVEITDVITNSVILDSKIDDLQDRKISIAGEDESGMVTSEIAQIVLSEPYWISTNDQDKYQCTKLTLKGLYSDFLPRLKPETVTINANVTAATHGETKQEILGNGDQSQRMQQFVLKQNPLTYTPSTTSSGAKNSLQIRVNGTLWKEAQSLYSLKPKDPSYITRITETGQVHAIFGDGIRGRLLPTGSQNISAKYRVGTGIKGNLQRDQLKILMTRPLGVTGVTNPIPAGGGADPDDIDKARQNAPLTVLTLDRVVSLSDFEDFARSFAGVGKAQAVWVWTGSKKIVHITIAPAEDTDALVSLKLRCKDLNDVIHASGDPTVAVLCQPFIKKYFGITAEIVVDDSRNFDDVKKLVEQTLYSKFSYDARNLGQDVTESEVLSTIQEVEGVVAANLISLHPYYEHKFSSGPAALLFKELKSKRGIFGFQIRSLPAHWQNKIVSGELLILKQGQVQISKMPTGGAN